MERVTQAQRSFYDEVGGHDTFHKLVSRFYRLVREDEVLRPLYPEDELDAAEERLRMFLEQYWGGPRTYSDRRGHPRLSQRDFLQPRSVLLRRLAVVCRKVHI